MSNLPPLDSDAPAQDLVAITASDSVNLEPEIRGFICDVAGVVAVVTPADTVQNITVKAGIVYPIAAKRINQTDTTATGITGLR